MATKWLRRFWRDDSGLIVAWMLLWGVIFLGFAGLAIDLASVQRTRAMLQATADASAHAGLVALKRDGQAAAVAAARSAASGTMPAAFHGAVIGPGDVSLGRWDRGARTFTSDPIEPNAVRVVAGRTAANGNPQPMALLQVLGIESLDIAMAAVAESSQPPCLYNGIVARGIVKMQHRNSFGDQICVHGQSGVHVGERGRGRDNSFGAETQVSAIGLDLILGEPDLNTNLSFTAGRLDPRMVDRLPEDIAALRDGQVFGESWPVVSLTGAEFEALLDGECIASLGDVTITGFTNASPGGGGGGGGTGGTTTPDCTGPAGLQPQTVYDIACDGQLTLGQTTEVTLRDIVLIADCRLAFSAKADLDGVTLVSTANGPNAEVHFAAQQDQANPGGCESFGGVRIMTPGDVAYAAQQGIANIQIVAGGDVTATTQFVAEGVSIQAGGDILFNSENSFSTCPGGPEPALTAPYFRIID